MGVARNGRVNERRQRCERGKRRSEDGREMRGGDGTTKTRAMRDGWARDDEDGRRYEGWRLA